jgi:P27 family predicted phage terminase small subunit
MPRRRTPTQIRLVTGNPSKRPLPKGEPKPQSGAPPLPLHIGKNKTAAGEWRRICGLTQLKNANVLTIADGPMLEATVSAYATFRKANDEITKHGFTYESVGQSGGIMHRQRPEVAIAADAWRRYVGGLTHFGLSPATRSKVQTNDEQEDGDEAEGFFSR